jgi:hypothetical protein
MLEGGLRVAWIVAAGGGHLECVGGEAGKPLVPRNGAPGRGVGVRNCGADVGTGPAVRWQGGRQTATHAAWPRRLGCLMRPQYDRMAVVGASWRHPHPKASTRRTRRPTHARQMRGGPARCRSPQEHLPDYSLLLLGLAARAARARAVERQPPSGVWPQQGPGAAIPQQHQSTVCWKPVHIAGCLAIRGC